MFKTGNIFIDTFSQGMVFIPLLPVIIILIRSIYQKDVLTFLMILCLLNFIGSLILWIPRANKLSLIPIQNIFSLLELLVLLQILKAALRGRPREYLKIFLIALLSASVTYYSLQGMDRTSMFIASLQDGIILVITATSLLHLIRNNHLYIFHSPLFWIAVGTLFYFVMTALLDVAGRNFMQLPSSSTTDKVILLNIASLIRYFFYTLAVLFYHSSRSSDNTPLF
jgi:hypothetical protein